MNSHHVRTPDVPLAMSIGLAVAALLCGCRDETGQDAGTTAPDASVDAGAQPVDPEVDWATIPAGSFTFGSPDGTPCIKPLMEKTVPMPILRAHEARRIIVCNLDDRPGYSGVENDLYARPNVVLLFGDAKSTVAALADGLEPPPPGAAA